MHLVFTYRWLVVTLTVGLRMAKLLETVYANLDAKKSRVRWIDDDISSERHPPVITSIDRALAASPWLLD